MKTFAIAGLAVTLLAGASGLQARQAAQKDQSWLGQLVGEWDSEAEVVMEPGKPPVKSRGTESVRAIGLWIVAENRGSIMDMPFTGLLTVGYDPLKRKFIGTWIDSISTYLWKYEGTMDATGKVLTLETEGPNPAAGGKLARFRDVIELKSKDHRVLTSSMQGEDGKWMTFLTVNYRRKK